MPYGKTTIINSPYDVNKHITYGVTKTIQAIVYEQNHTLLNYSAFLYNVGKCRGEGVQRKRGKKENMI